MTQRYLIYQQESRYTALTPDAGKWFYYDTKGNADNDRGPFNTIEDCQAALSKRILQEALESGIKRRNEAASEEVKQSYWNLARATQKIWEIQNQFGLTDYEYEEDENKPDIKEHGNIGA